MSDNLQGFQITLVYHWPTLWQSLNDKFKKQDKTFKIGYDIFLFTAYVAKF